MKTASAAFLTLSLAVAEAALAAPPDPPAQSILRRADLKLKVNSPFFRAPQFDLPEGPYSDLDAAMAGLKNAADALKAAKKGYDEARESCKTKSYTNQEIQAACAGDDTVDQCSEKLYAHCLGSPFRAIKLAADRLSAAETKLEKAIHAVVLGASKRI